MPLKNPLSVPDILNGLEAGDGELKGTHLAKRIQEKGGWKGAGGTYAAADLTNGALLWLVDVGVVEKNGTKYKLLVRPAVRAVLPVLRPARQDKAKGLKLSADARAHKLKTKRVTAEKKAKKVRGCCCCISLLSLAGQEKEQARAAEKERDRPTEPLSSPAVLAEEGTVTVEAAGEAQAVDEVSTWPARKGVRSRLPPSAQARSGRRGGGGRGRAQAHISHRRHSRRGGDRGRGGRRSAQGVPSPPCALWGLTLPPLSERRSTRR